MEFHVNDWVIVKVKVEEPYNLDANRAAQVHEFEGRKILVRSPKDKTKADSYFMNSEIRYATKEEIETELALRKELFEINDNVKLTNDKYGFYTIKGKLIEPHVQYYINGKWVNADIIELDL